jgi:hypothetical protein
MITSKLNATTQCWCAELTNYNFRITYQAEKIKTTPDAGTSQDEDNHAVQDWLVRIDKASWEPCDLQFGLVEVGE